MRKQVGKVDFLGSFPSSPPVHGLDEVAFVGRSNVGKSSALNCILARKRAARVSSRPGRTQAINLFQVGDSCVFADLPGYGYARVPEAVQEAWRESIEAYFAERECLRLVVVLVDARREPQELDGQLLFALTTYRIPALVVATKVDKLSRRQRRAALTKIQDEFRLGEEEPVAFSAVTGEGRDKIWDRIERACKEH